MQNDAPDPLSIVQGQLMPGVRLRRLNEAEEHVGVQVPTATSTASLISTVFLSTRA